MFDPDLHRRSIHIPISLVDQEGVKKGLPQDPDALQMQMSVIDAGPRHAARTMVFVHGFGGRAAYWHHQLAYFSEYYRVLAPDLRGHGLSDAPFVSYSPQQLAIDLENMLREMEAPEHFILVAHSFGGAVATCFTERNPERVSQLVLIGSPVQFKLLTPGRVLLRLPPVVMNSLRRFIPRAKLYPPSHVVHAQNRDGLRSWDGSFLLTKITCPSLVIRGERDFLFDNQSFDQVAKLIPQAEEVIIPVTAHQVMVERPDAVNRAIERFLGEVDLRQERSRKVARQKLLEKQRPWLKWYDSRTPMQIRPPHGPISRYLEIAARRFPKTIALYFYGHKINYEKLDRLSNRFAHGLARLELNKGDRVVIALPNIPQAVIAFYGVLKAGGVVVFLDSNHLTDHQIFERSQQVGAKILIALTNRYKGLHQPPQGHSIQKVIFTTLSHYMGLWEQIKFGLTQYRQQGHAIPTLGRITDRKTVQFFIEVLGFKRQRPEFEPNVDDLAILQFTSHVHHQTPKIAALTHRNLASNCLQLRHWLPEARPGDERILSIVPFANTYGLNSSVALAPLLGASLVLLPKFDIKRVIQAIKQTKPTLFPGVPLMYQLLAFAPNIRKSGIASIRVCTSAGSPLPLETHETFEKLTRGKLIEVYGLSEAGATHATPIAARRRLGSIGLPVPDTLVKVVNPDTGHECQVEEKGELWVKGPQVMLAYWNDAQQRPDPQLTTNHGWYQTGDVVWFDDDYFFYFVDRLENRIDYQGRKFYPRELEEILYEHPAVLEACVLLKGHRLAAFIACRQGQAIEAQAFRKWVQKRFPEFYWFDDIGMMERLPRTASGKIDRKAL